MICEYFDGPRFDPRLRWHCPPPDWSIEASHLVIRPGAPTDFWQRTHYGFSADNGHFLWGECAGAFSLSTRVQFTPVHQYDQAGLMVRWTSECWIKSSVEFEPNGPSRLGVVITREGYSDWSTQHFPPDRDTIDLRLLLQGSDVLVQYLEATASDSSAASSDWRQLRLGHLPIPEGATVQAGIYACSPKGAGFSARFDHLVIESI